MQDGQADHLVAPVPHDDVIGAKLTVGRLNSRLKVYVHHVGRLVIRALHRSLWSLQHRGDHVEKITSLDEGHNCRLCLKSAATREVMNAVITKPSCDSISLKRSIQKYTLLSTRASKRIVDATDGVRPVATSF